MNTPPSGPSGWPAERIAQAEALLPSAWLRACLWDKRPQFYALRPAKEALAEALGPDMLAQWWMAALDQPGPWRARWCPLVGLLDHARAQGWAVEEFAPSRWVDIPVLRSVGGADLPAARHRCRSVALVRVPQVTVYSKSNLLRVGEAALLDHQLDEMQRVPCFLATDGAVLAAEGDKRVAVPERDAALPALDRALSLLGLHSFAYGHWLAELLPKLWACLDRPDVTGLTVLVDAQMPAQHMEALRLVLPEGHPVQVVRPGEQWRVRELWAVTAPLFYPIGPDPRAEEHSGWDVLDADYFAELIRRIAPRWQARVPSAGVRRLYLSRPEGSHRRLLNREAVEEWHRRHGFQVVDLSRLSFTEQLSLVRDARIIVGPEGSAFATAFFAPRGARLAELAGLALNHHESYLQISTALGQHRRVCNGRQPQARAPGEYFGNYEIDLALLPEVLWPLRHPAQGARPSIG